MTREPSLFRSGNFSSNESKIVFNIKINNTEELCQYTGKTT